jgi:hypothetical protein
MSVASGEYGGGAKRTNLFFFSSAAVSLCFGFVGVGAKRFCLKPVKVNKNMCGIAKHANKFAPSDCHFYLLGVDSMAFCSLYYSEELVPVHFRDDIRSTTKTIEEWKALFSGYLVFVLDDAGETELNHTHDKLCLKTPKKFMMHLQIYGL